MANEERIIDANEWLEQFWKRVSEGKITTVYDIQEAIMNAPIVDAVRVVRCKHCEHRGDADKCPMCSEEYVERDYDGYYETDYVLHDCTTDDGFCHMGERKDGDGNG